MNNVRAIASTASRRSLAPRIGQVARRTRTYATEREAQSAPAHPPTSPPNPSYDAQPKEPSKSGAFYKSFGSPMLKCFLGALFTYQIAYYGWMKLEAIEEKHELRMEIRDLQRELGDALRQQKLAAQETIDGAVEAVGEVRDRVVAGVGEVADSVKEGAEEATKATDAVRRVAKGGWWP
ncbi:hypothetical protein P153DRAFT_362961 [Dothidotthia symphoricarpi CBS 119687]|uniref:Uncharacterized protein n=1 Tax=Dothidotthia symphoricarpi CBS 119687 TaxID=1392245 RepID=A0A6A6APT2_9PLEO|nr:uncharacterized protein P153DRAFT_362961 [Dothidotthia symphoricarpi CBS 119687]KAF2133929.1 hypothetical protein P153DRAFT_362961 [Dothidotthia symphoricarpi CBS 119687]